MTLLSKIQKYSLTAENYSSLMAKTYVKSYDDFKCKTSNDKSNRLSVGEFQHMTNMTHEADQTLTKTKQTNTQANTPVQKTYMLNVKDQLFWCLMLIVNKWDDNDIPEPRDRFDYESKKKTELTELLQKNKDIQWKLLKVSRTAATMGLSSSINGKINFNVLKALAFLYKYNIIYTWGKTYISLDGGRSNHDPIEYEKWYVIIKKRSGFYLATDEYAKEIMKMIENKDIYRVDDPNKPLMAESTYKLDELQNIAIKYDISITRDGNGNGNGNGKRKVKKELYNEIINKIQKID